MRRQTWDQIATTVGGPAERDYRLVFDALDALGGTAAEWVPVGAGEKLKREVGAAAAARSAADRELHSVAARGIRGFVCW